MNRGQVLAVDFEKRELKDTQQNSDIDKQSFYRNKTKICNDALLRLYGELVGSHVAYEQFYEERDLAHSDNAAYRRDCEASQQLCEEVLIEIKNRAMNV
jgi:hypothetical protein